MGTKMYTIEVFANGWMPFDGIEYADGDKCLGSTLNSLRKAGYKARQKFVGIQDIVTLSIANKKNIQS